MPCWRVIECSAPVRYYIELRVPGPEGVAQLGKRLLHLHKAQAGFQGLHETSHGIHACNLALKK